MSSNLRPRMGVVSIVRWFSVVLDAVFDVSMVGAWVVTVTVSAMPETFRTAVIRAVWPTVSSTACWTSVANPDSLNVTV